jgi:hypothetical protein
VQAGWGDHVAAVGSHVDARADTIHRVPELPGWRGEQQVPATGPGADPWARRQWSVFVDEVPHRVDPTVAGIDVDHDEPR